MRYVSARSGTINCYPRPVNSVLHDGVAGNLVAVLEHFGDSGLLCECYFVNTCNVGSRRERASSKADVAGCTSGHQKTATAEL